MHHQYSSSVSPFQANTGTPASAIAAAAWSCVEKMLQEHPAHVGAERDERLDQHRGLHGHVEGAHDLAPFSGCCAPYSSRIAIRPGISCSASVDLLAAELGERKVCDLEVLRGRSR